MDGKSQNIFSLPAIAFIVLLMTAILTGCGGGGGNGSGGGGGDGDAEPPTVNVTKPTNGATINGTVTIEANASDNIGVISVEFFVGSVSQGTDTTAPYSATWDTNTSSNGSHVVTATAQDAAGNTKNNSVTVTVNNGAAIAVRWPIGGTTTPDCVQDPFGHRLLAGKDDLHLGTDTCDDNPLDIDGINGNDNDEDVGFDIRVIADGTVTLIRPWDPAWDATPALCPSFCRQGNYLMVRHPDLEPQVGNTSVQTVYMHMSEIAAGLSAGDTLNVGDLLGKVGKTGLNINTTHLHMGLILGTNDGQIRADNYINPLTVLPYTRVAPHGLTLTRVTDTSMYDSGECTTAVNTLRITVAQEHNAIDTVRIEATPLGAPREVFDIHQRIGIGSGSGSARDDFEQGCTAVTVDNFREDTPQYVLNINFGGDYTGINDYAVQITDVRGNTDSRVCTIAADDTPTACLP